MWSRVRKQKQHAADARSSGAELGNEAILTGKTGRTAKAPDVDEEKKEPDNDKHIQLPDASENMSLPNVNSDLNNDDASLRTLETASVSSLPQASAWNGEIVAEVQQLNISRSTKAGPLPRDMKMVLAFVHLAKNQGNNKPVEFCAMTELSKAMKKKALSNGQEEFVAEWRKLPRGDKISTTTVELECLLSSLAPTLASPSSTKSSGSKNEELVAEDLGLVIGMVNKNEHRSKRRPSRPSAGDNQPFSVILPVAWTRLVFPAARRRILKGSCVAKLDMTVLEDLGQFPMFRIPKNTWDLSGINPSPSSEYIFCPQVSSVDDLKYFDYSVSRKYPMKTGRDVLRFFSFNEATLQLSVKWTKKSAIYETIPPGIDQPFAQQQAQQGDFTSIAPVVAAADRQKTFTNKKEDIAVGHDNDEASDVLLNPTNNRRVVPYKVLDSSATTTDDVITKSATMSQILTPSSTSGNASGSIVKDSRPMYPGIGYVINQAASKDFEGIEAYGSLSKRQHPMLPKDKRKKSKTPQSIPTIMEPYTENFALSAVEMDSPPKSHLSLPPKSIKSKEDVDNNGRNQNALIISKKSPTFEVANVSSDGSTALTSAPSETPMSSAMTQEGNKADQDGKNAVTGSSAPTVPGQTAAQKQIDNITKEIISPAKPPLSPKKSSNSSGVDQTKKPSSEEASTLEKAAPEKRSRSGSKHNGRPGVSLLSRFFRRNTTKEPTEEEGAPEEEDLVLKTTIQMQPPNFPKEEPMLDGATNQTLDTSVDSVGVPSVSPNAVTTPLDAVQVDVPVVSLSAENTTRKLDKEPDARGGTARIREAETIVPALGINGNVIDDQMKDPDQEKDVAVEVVISPSDLRSLTKSLSRSSTQGSNNRRSRTKSPNVRRTRSQGTTDGGSKAQSPSIGAGETQGLSSGRSTKRNPSVERNDGSVNGRPGTRSPSVGRSQSSGRSRTTSPFVEGPEDAGILNMFGRNNSSNNSQGNGSNGVKDGYDDNIMLGFEIENIRTPNSIDNRQKDDDLQANSSFGSSPSSKRGKHTRKKKTGAEDSVDRERSLEQKNSWNEAANDYSDYSGSSCSNDEDDETEPSVAIRRRPLSIRGLLDNIHANQRSALDFWDHDSSVDRSRQQEESVGDLTTIHSGQSVVSSIPNPSDVVMRDIYYSCGAKMISDALEWATQLGEHPSNALDDRSHEDDSTSSY
ncbi:hypothetical protein ACA910_004026 [Epithemia clementina (nom. ined.)]